MDWLDTVKDGVKKTTDFAVAKSNELLEATKLRFAANETENQINELAQLIGKKLYNDYKNGAEIGEDYMIFCQDMDAKQLNLAQLNEQIAKLKNVKICPRCNKENVPEANYCNACGEKMD